MRLTKFSDYAIRVCLYLGAHQDRTVAISEMAQAYGLSKNNLMKVVQMLVEGKILKSTRGRTGGVRLARPASEIRLGQIVRLIEGDSTLIDCESCILTGDCGLIRPFGDAKLAFYQSLDRMSLADAIFAHPGTLPKLQAAAKETAKTDS